MHHVLVGNVKYLLKKSVYVGEYDQSINLFIHPANLKTVLVINLFYSSLL